MQREQELQDESEVLEKCEGQNSLENSDVLEDKRIELESIRAAKIKASLVRTKLKEYEYGDKPSKYFFFT